MARSVVIVDAGYLFKAGGQLVAGRECRREELILDGPAAVSLMSETAATISNRELLRIYWYDAALRGPTPEHRAVAELHHVKLRLGHLNSAGQQKGVDPLIITDMITLARNRACDEIILVSGDADLVVGVLQAQEHGVRVHLVGIAPSRGNQAPELRQEADTSHEWNAEAIGTFLRVATPGEVAARVARRRSVSPRVRPNDVPSLMTVDGPVQIAPDVTETPPQGATVVGQTASEVTVRPSEPQAAIVEVVARLTEGHLRTVAEAVERGLQPDERRQVLSSGRPGIIPGEIDRKLLGTARAMFHTLLDEPEKRLLRRQLHQACSARAEQPESTDQGTQ